jgi:hypothetical protein
MHAYQPTILSEMLPVTRGRENGRDLKNIPFKKRTGRKERARPLHRRVEKPKSKRAFYSKS